MNTKTTAKYTAGPWRLELRLSTATIFGPQGRIAELRYLLSPMEYMDCGNTIAEANARLIAAAPDLLAAAEIAPEPPALLEMSRDKLLRWGLHYADWWRDWRGAAIGRARG